MYIVSFRIKSQATVSCDSYSLTELTNLLEKNKIDFKVSGKDSLVKQEDLGYGGYEHWK